ncbi:MAG: 23S rRNA (uridine2552-2'-O)-methyltransferase [Halothiobacillaceae bacterium]|nr:MAG: 23S rRNA (uridine2552-2'-O)-methyltransferase [Halothiobacillaceae bacterium]
MAKRASSQKWLQRHVDDEFVRRAQVEGYRSRAVYKLLEIEEKERIFRAGMTVVDLGAAPGGWSQVAIKKVQQGRIIALDILPMTPLEGVHFIEGDFREESVLHQLLSSVDGGQVDLVLSDMAPNSSGMKAVDQPRAIYLAELALDFARQRLTPGGDFVVKVFQGSGFEAFHNELRRSFSKVVIRKPKASRTQSRETYILGRGYKVG